MLGLDQEMKEVVGEIDLRHEVLAAEEIPDCMKSLHLEVLVSQVAIEWAKI